MNNKVMRFLIASTLSLGLSGAVNAAEAKAPKSAAKDSNSQTHSFEDLLVQGKYHFSSEAVTTVEDDKVLDSLLGIRTDFKDRMESSAGRH